MALNRYLIYMSYIGKPFIGAQRQAPRSPLINDPLTVQGRLEIALKILNPCNDPAVSLSSRTDAGVNAMSSTCHVDLYRKNGLVYQPKTVTLCLNKYFKREDVPIRILKTYLVPEGFKCQSAISRTYLYRVIVSKVESTSLTSFIQHVPIEEVDRGYVFYSSEFDVEAMKRAAKLFEGLHDFRTFMGRESYNPDKITRRIVDMVQIREGKPLVYSPYSWPAVTGRKAEDYQFLDIYIKSKGFVYRQVRRMVATLLAVAQGKVSSSDIKLMLEVPSKNSWNQSVKTAPAHGLYLCEVEYSEEDKACFIE